jgi:L-ascorbate metabolism protein UlaG (beta-lactamase superfamily)
MILTYLGHQAYKMQFGDLTIAIDPPSKDSTFKTSKFGANIVLQSLNHEDMGGGKDMAYGDKAPFVISGPGEYETNGVFIKGLASKSEYDGEKRINTIYSLTVDGLNVLFLGAHEGDLPSGISDIIESVDIVVVPIGGKGVLDAKTAYKVANDLEPKIIIPSHFENIKDESLKTFLKEAGVTAAPVDKLTIKRKDVEGKEGEVIVLAPQA